MELINNRYRIIKSINQNQIVYSYLATDLLNKNQLVELNIINSEFIPKDTLKYYIDEFITLSNIKNPHIVKLYDFGLVNSIDGKYIKNTQYFLSKQYIKNLSSLSKFIDKLDKKDLLENFLLICSAINYFHLKGYTYSELSWSNILVDSNKNQLFLKDFFTLQLEKLNSWESKEDLLIYKAPEILSGMTYSHLSDIYSLGIILFTMFKNLFNKIVTSKTINKSNLTLVDNTDEFSNNLLKIILKMIDEAPNSRYKNISEIVDDINFYFNKDFKLFDKKTLQKLNFDTKLIGRNYEVNKILSFYNSLEKRISDKNLVLIHGQSGTGKTKLLRELCRLFSFKNANTYSSFHLSLVNSSFYPITGILRKMMSECDPELINKYETDLLNLLPQLERQKDSISNELLNSSNEQENFKLLTKIFNFMYEFMKNKSSVFIIDNFHLWDEFSIKLIEYLYIKTSSKNNVLFIFSYKSSNETNISSKFIELITKLKDSKDTFNLNLNGLNKEETCEVVQNILGFQTIPTNLAEKIFSQTSGNPLFIEELIKNLYVTNSIFIDEKTGFWCSEDLNQLPIPNSIEQAALNQTKDLDDLSLEILTVISIFINPIPIDLIKHFINSDSSVIEKYIEYLISIGVLCTKIDDTGFLLDFSNKILKNLVYSKLDESEKQHFHSIVVSILEKEDSNYYINKEDIIYHLEQANLKDKLLQYCIEKSQKMEALRNTTVALRNLMKALSTFSKDSHEEIKLKLIMKIGEIYSEEGKFNEAIDCFLEIIRLSKQSDNLIIEIDTYNRLIEIYILKNRLDKAMELISSLTNMLNSIEYKEGYLQAMYLTSYIYWLKLEYNKALEIAETALKYDSKHYPKQQASLLRVIGNIYLSKNDAISALDYYNRSLDILNKHDLTKDILLVYSSIARVYFEYYKDIKTAMDYYSKINSLSKKNNYILHEVISTINLASCYFAKFDHESSFEYAKIALEKSLEIGYESITFYCYCLMVRICVSLSRFSDAYYYLSLAEKELNSYPIQANCINIYNISVAYCLHMFGNVDKSQEYAKKIIDTSSNFESIDFCNSVVLYQWSIIQSSKSISDIYNAVEEILQVTEQLSLPIDKLFFLTGTILRLEYVPIKKVNLITEKLFSIIEKVEIDDLPDRIKARILYCRAKFGKNVDKIPTLISAYSKANKCSNKLLAFRAACALGELYYLRKNFFYSVNYYFEACELVQQMVSQVPEEHKIPFVKNYKLLTPFLKLNYYKTNNIKLSKVDPEDLYSNLSFEDLNNIINHDNFKTILNSKELMASAKKIYNETSIHKIYGIKDLVVNMSSDPIKNLELILHYISSVTFATYGCIIVENETSNYNILASTNKSKLLTENINIIDKVKALKDIIHITNISNDVTNNSINNNAKAVICMPIIMYLNDFIIDKDKALKNPYNIHDLIKITGYLYLESDRVLNNFNKNSIKKCLELSRLIGSCIEKYNLKVSSSIDKLTGTLTRKYLEQYIVDNINKSNLCNEPFSLLMFDVDHFKSINDQFGHQVGDEVLAKLCKVALDSIGPEDFCGRYGGEEFIIILPSVRSKEAYEKAEKIRKRVENETLLGNKTVTISIGIACYPEHSQWKQDLIEKVDQALYGAKQSGRNKTTIWNSSFTANTKSRDKLTGIISGNSIQDSRSLLILAELINLLKNNHEKEKNLSAFLNKVMEITEAQAGAILAVENNLVTKSYCQKSYGESKEEFKNCNGFNKSVVNSVINSEKGLYLIDWDEVIGYDLLTGIPSWNSILVVPIIFEATIRGIIYLTSQTKHKEFSDKEFNFVNAVAPLLGSMLEK